MQHRKTIITGCVTFVFIHQTRKRLLGFINYSVKLDPSGKISLFICFRFHETVIWCYLCRLLTQQNVIFRTQPISFRPPQCITQLWLIPGQLLNWLSVDLISSSPGKPGEMNGCAVSCVLVFVSFCFGWHYISLGTLSTTIVIFEVNSSIIDVVFICRLYIISFCRQNSNNLN